MHFCLISHRFLRALRGTLASLALAWSGLARLGHAQPGWAMPSQARPGPTGPGLAAWPDQWSSDTYPILARILFSRILVSDTYPSERAPLLEDPEPRTGNSDE